MIKQTVIALLSIAALSLTACSSQDITLDSIENGVSLDQQVNSLATKKNSFIVRTDWYENLSPDLQQYYADAKGKTGAELFDALNKIISEKNSINSYQDSKSFMYAVADNVNSGSKKGVFDAYSGIFAVGSGGNGNSYKENGDENKDGVSGDFINCEHTWPQSFFSKANPMVADIHHLQSTMSVPNNRRSHFPFGNVSGAGEVVYTTSGGSKLALKDRTSKNRSKAEMIKIINMPDSNYEAKAAILDAEFEATFEPWDKQKGNTARAMMYFYTRYYKQNIRQGEFSEKAFWDSKVPTFIQWSTQIDPVDAQEKTRNDIVFKKQGNRNPFVDVPDFAVLIGEQVFQSK